MEKIYFLKVNTSGTYFGQNCATIFGTPPRVTIYENSGGSKTIALSVNNTDQGFSSNAPSYGVYSSVPNITNPYRCSGYFNTTNNTPLAPTYLTPTALPTGFPETPFALFTAGIHLPSTGYNYGGRVAFGYSSFTGIPSVRLNVNGNANIQGALWTSATFQGSDSIFKTNVNTINNSTRNLLNHLRPVSYYFDTVTYQFMNFGTGKQFGFIAQEMDTVYDNLVSAIYYPAEYDSAGTTLIHDSLWASGINYTSVIPLLVSGYQNHDSLITSIQNNFKGAQNGAWIDTGKVEWGTSPLLHNTTLPMVSLPTATHNEWSIYFTGQSSMDNSNNPVDLGIGYDDTTIVLGAKLDVKDSTFNGEGFNYVNQYAGRFYQTGVYFVDAGSDDMVGVMGSSDVLNTTAKSTNLGGDFYAQNSNFNNIGGRGTANGSAGNNYGLQGIATNAGISIGVLGTSNGTSSSIGISGYADGTTSNIGILGGAVTGGGIVSYAGYFSGDLAYTGALISISDSTVKQNIHPIIGAQAILNQVHPKVYNFDTVQYGYMNLKGGTEYGVLAQDLMNVLPSAVKDVIQPAVYDNQNIMIHPALHLKGVDYIEFIPLLIQSNRQMDSTIQALQSQLIALQNCCDKNQPPQQNSIRQKDGGNGDNGNDGSEKKLENGNIHAIELSNATGSPIIYQNIPNPFSNGGTKIRYFVPDNTNSPQIVFFDEFGGKLSTFNILETGMGELDVTASNLSSGVYSYSLIINGKAIDTKKMIFQK